jgi:AraC family transcriptional activator of pobA
MKKTEGIPVRITSISELHRMLGLPKPLHPLISITDNSQLAFQLDNLPNSFVFDFYKVSYKKTPSGKIKYGQGHYDFEEGTMVFTAPLQVLAVGDDEDTSYYGITLNVHPDFLRNHPLGNAIKNYGFFSYDVHEALHLSDKEKSVILNLYQQMRDELELPIDDFSQDVMISYLEVLFNYSNRFYKRQFITRKAVNHDLLTRLEHILNEYFDSEASLSKGLPTVEHLATQLHVSPRYLSDMLRSLTGQNAQQHIHEKMIARAKEYLTLTNMSVGEIAYHLGFERPQSFNKLFKQKTNLSPLAYRESFL